MASTGGGSAQGLGQEGLADTDGADEEDVLLAQEELERKAAR